MINPTGMAKLHFTTPIPLKNNAISGLIIRILTKIPASSDVNVVYNILAVLEGTSKVYVSLITIIVANSLPYLGKRPSIIILWLLSFDESSMTDTAKEIPSTCWTSSEAFEKISSLQNVSYYIDFVDGVDIDGSAGQADVL